LIGLYEISILYSIVLYPMIFFFTVFDFRTHDLLLPFALSALLFLMMNLVVFLNGSFVLI